MISDWINEVNYLTSSPGSHCKSKESLGSFSHCLELYSNKTGRSQKVAKKLLWFSHLPRYLAVIASGKLWLLLSCFLANTCHWLPLTLNHTEKESLGKLFLFLCNMKMGL